MAYKAYVTQLKNVRKHPNADRLLLGDCFGNTVCVNLNYTEGQVGVYFPTDGQLSVTFAEANNLLRKKDENGNNVGGYMDPDKRNVKAIKLRGEKSDGLFLPLTCLDFCYPDINGGAEVMLNVGDTIDVINGIEICTKYIPRGKKNRQGKEGNRTRKRKVPVAPLFMEHADTEQLAYNLGEFRPGDEIEITLKMHGTSQRTGYLPVFKGYAPDFWGKIANSVDPNKKLGKLARSLYERSLRYATPIYDWGYVSGTRRTVLEDFEGGYYGSNEFREDHSKYFEGKLWKGETVYYEVVGFTTDGGTIMGKCNNKKLNDEEFVKTYGEETVFSYGCRPDGCHGTELLKMVIPHDENEETEIIREPQSAAYVYRMTMTNEDGDVIEYTPHFMRYRCEQMGAKVVPVFAKGRINGDGTFGWYNYLDEADYVSCLGDEVYEGDPLSWNYIPGESVKEVAEQFYNGPDPIGRTHIREGVVVRIVNRPKFAAYKHKNFEFKVLEGIIKESAAAPDMEEAQEVEDN